MISANIIQRTFHIRWKQSTGTAFTIDHNGREYLITARHVVENINSGENINIFHEHQWKNLSVQLVSDGKEDVDIAVMSAPFALSPRFELKPSLEGIMTGQQVHFLGYPFGWNAGGEYINNGYPMQFVKGGIVSAITKEGENLGKTTKLYIDAHGNKGFSGGPVVYVPNGWIGNLEAFFKRRFTLNVGGIVSYYPTPTLAPVVDEKGRIVTDQNKGEIGIEENPGFVVAIGIEHALELINENPIGFKLPNI